MIESIVICQHGKLGYTASLRFTDSVYDAELSADRKERLYKNIEYIVRKVNRKTNER